jgi:hypothetical protein
MQSSYLYRLTLKTYHICDLFICLVLAKIFITLLPARLLQYKKRVSSSYLIFKMLLFYFLIKRAKFNSNTQRELERRGLGADISNTTGGGGVRLIEYIECEKRAQVT